MQWDENNYSSPERIRLSRLKNGEKNFTHFERKPLSKFISEMDSLVTKKACLLGSSLISTKKPCAFHPKRHFH